MAKDRETAATDGKTGRSAEDEDESGLTRRRWVTAGAATWASASLAGCYYLTGPGDEPGATTTSEPTTTTSDGTSPTTSAPGNNTNTTVTTQTTTTDSPDGDGGGATTTDDCGSISTFTTEMEIGFIVGVYESTTGKFVGSDAIESVTVEFPSGVFEPLTLEWEGPHETFSTQGWGQDLYIGADVPPGTYQYEVTIEPRDFLGIDPTTVIDQFTIQ